MSNVNMGSRNAPKEGRKPINPRASIVEICMALHGENCGSGDPVETYEEDLRFLKDRVRQWLPNCAEQFQEFDNAIFHLAHATIKECELQKRR